MTIWATSMRSWADPITKYCSRVCDTRVTSTAGHLERRGKPLRKPLRNGHCRSCSWWGKRLAIRQIACSDSHAIMWSVSGYKSFVLVVDYTRDLTERRHIPAGKKLYSKIPTIPSWVTENFMTFLRSWARTQRYLMIDTVLNPFANARCANLSTFFVSNAIIPSYLKTNNLLLFFVTAGAGAAAVHHSSCDSQEPLQARRWDQLYQIQKPV